MHLTIMTLDQLAPIVVFAFATSITPGPNNAMLLTSGANFGFRATLPHLLGVNLGFALMIVAVGLGLGGLFTAVPVLQVVLRYAGAAYLLTLAWRIARSGGPASQKDRAQPFTFVQAAGFQWVNPKGWMSAIGVVTTYTPSEGFLWNLVLITAIYIAVMLSCTSLWTGAGTAMRGFLSEPARLRAFNIVMAILLVVSLYPVLITSWP